MKKNYLQTSSVILVFILHSLLQRVNAGCGLPAPSISVKHDYGLAYRFDCTSAKYWHFKWLFGDGDIGIVQWENHVYASEGNYTIKLIAWDSLKTCFDTFTWGVLCAVDNKFTMRKNKGLNYSFEEIPKVKTGKRFDWDFGDGGTGSGYLVSHTYATPQSYSVKCTIYDSLSTCGNALTQVLKATYSCINNDSFVSWVSCNQNRKDSMYFSSRPYYYPGQNKMTWIHWGDGTKDSLANSNYKFGKSHTYTSAGTYNLMLINMDTAQCRDTLYQSTKISDTSLFNRFFDFSYYKTKDSLYLDLVSNMTDAFEYWMSGGVGASPYPKWAFVYPKGQYNVCAHFKDGVCYRSVCKTVQMGTRCHAEFNKHGDSLKKFTSIVRNLSFGSRIHWDFGDGDTSSAYTPNHTYAGRGPYNLCVTTYDSACTSSYCDTIEFDTSGFMLRSGITLIVVDHNGNKVNTKNTTPETFSVYPNPASHSISIRSQSHSSPVKIEIHSISGALVYSHSPNKMDQDRVIEVPVAQLQPGLYFVTIIDSQNRAQYQKIEIER